MTENYHRLAEVRDTSFAKGGLSMSNGQCVLVSRRADGCYEVRDSKLGRLSPTWLMSAAQFHALGRELDWRTGMLSVATAAGLSIELPEGAVFTASRDDVPDSWCVCTLSTSPDLMRFSTSELRAFCWGYHSGQFPAGAPVQEAVYTC